MLVMFTCVVALAFDFFNGFHDLFLSNSDRVDGGSPRNCSGAA